MRVVMDTSVQTFLRKNKLSLLQSLKKLLYAGTGKHQPSENTKKLIQQELAPVNEPLAVAAVLNGMVPPPSPPESDWRLLLRGLNGGGPDIVRDIADELAAFDDIALQIRELTRVGDTANAAAHTQALLGTSAQAWKALNPRMLLAPQVLLLLESSLQTLARLTCRINIPGVDLPSRESSLTQLLEPKRRPLGHWLTEVRLASGCKSLAALAQRLDSAISHDRLKAWSSSKKVAVPHSALKPVLRGVRIRAQAETQEDRYYVARLMTFLCDLGCAAIPGEAPGWADIQAQLRSRFVQLYRLELERQVVPEPEAWRA
jgi:hypothetical protein